MEWIFALSRYTSFANILCAVFFKGTDIWTLHRIGGHLAPARWTFLNTSCTRDFFAPLKVSRKFSKSQDFWSRCLASSNFKNFQNRAIIRWLIPEWSRSSFEILKFWSSLATNTKIRVWTSKLQNFKICSTSHLKNSMVHFQEVKKFREHEVCRGVHQAGARCPSIGWSVRISTPFFKCSTLDVLLWYTKNSCLLLLST